MAKKEVSATEQFRKRYFFNYHVSGGNGTFIKGETKHGN